MGPFSQTSFPAGRRARLQDFALTVDGSVAGSQLRLTQCPLSLNHINPLQLEVLKGTRWLLVKNAENLDTDPEKNEKERLNQALEQNALLAKAYYLKDELRQFWQQDSKKKAKEWLYQ